MLKCKCAFCTEYVVLDMEYRMLLQVACMSIVSELRQSAVSFPAFFTCVRSSGTQNEFESPGTYIVAHIGCDMFESQ